MAVIKYDELFDFPGYNKAIKDLETANKDFGKTVTDINNRIGGQYKEIKSELNDYLGVLKSFNVNQKGAADSIIKTGESAISAGKKIAEQKRIMQELLDVQNLSTRSVNELKAANKALETEYNSLKGSSDDVRAKKAALAAEARRVGQAVKEQTQALKANTKVLDEAENSYNALQAELSSIGKQLKAMPDAFDKTTGKINQSNKAAVDLSKRYAEINNTLKTADAQLGNFQRNVGNYASATFSLSQVLRELPSLGVSAQQFFLAISNNLPILFDQFGQLSKQVDQTTGKVIGSGGALKIFAQSIFSLGNLLTIGVTLLTVYGKEVGNFISELFTGKKVLTEAEAAIQSFNEALKSTDYSNAIQEVSELEKNIELAKNGFISKEKVLKQYNEGLGQTIGEAKNLNEAEQLLVKNKDAYLQMMLQKAVATTAFAEAAKKSVEAQVEAAKNPFESTKFTDDLKAAGKTVLSTFLNPFDTKKAIQGNVEQLKQIGEKRRQEAVNQANKDADLYTQIANKAQELAATISKENNFDFFGGQFEDKGKKSKGDDPIKKQQELLKSLLDKRVALFELAKERELISEEELQSQKLALVQKYVAAAIELENKRAKPDPKAIADFTKERIEAEKAYAAYRNKADAEALERAKKAIEEEAELNISALKDEQLQTLQSKRLTDVQKEALEIDYQNKIDRILIDSLERRIKLEVDAEKRKALEIQKAALERGIIDRGGKFDDKTLRDEYKAKVDAENKAFDLLEAGQDLNYKQKKAHLDRLEQLQKEYAKKGVDIEKDANETKHQGDILYAELKKQLEEETQAVLLESITTGLQITQNLINGNFEQNIANLQAEKEKELALAGNNAAARQRIEEEYNKKIAEQKNKQARADRAFALFNVAINTAQAISKTLAIYGGTPLAVPAIALVALQGALQAALILSRPLPKYKKGRKGGPAEFAVVDEAGPELIVDRHGRLKEVGGSKERITHLQAGDTVIPHPETKEIFKSIETQKIIREMELTGQLSSTIRKGKQDEMIYVMAKALEGNQINQRSMEAAFKNAVKEIPVQQLIVDERGQRLREKTVNHTTTYLNNLTKIG